MSSKRLGFVSARSAYLLPDGGVMLDPGVGRILEVLRTRYAALTVAMSTSPAPIAMNTHRLSRDARFLPMPFLTGVREGVFQARGCHAVIREVERASDAVVVQLPFASPAALLLARKPRVYHLCGDTREVARITGGYGGMGQIAARAAGEAIDVFNRGLFRWPRTRAVSNGAAMLEHYGLESKGRAVVSSTLLEAEIQSARRTRPAHAPFRLIFVGYLRYEKGIDTLVEAFRRLRAEGRNVELCFVGVRDTGDRGVSERVASALAGFQAEGLVQFTGALPFGPALFAAYAEADALLLPSLSEGTPRVLVEARAFGCPVIASNVGGVPTSVTDGVDGLLVPRGDAEALARAVARLMEDAGLRQRLIEGGLRRARACTVEAFANTMADEIDLAAS